VWQSLFEELSGHGLMILAIAHDKVQAARPWIEAAHPTYPCLIDSDHYVTELYNLVNVPQSVWIDETGKIVRPPGSGGSNDSFRSMDRKTGTMSPETQAERNRVKAMFVDAVRDWAKNGSASRYVLNEQQAQARMRLPDPKIAQAHAMFRLGQHLLSKGRQEEAAKHCRAAIELYPDSWTMWRQAAEKDPRGLAAGPEFWARVDALGDKLYHIPFE
jgi:hypothetical protein